MLAERRLQIEIHLEQYQAVVQEHLHGHRHVSEHVKFPKQQYKVTARSLQNLMLLTTSWKLRSWVGAPVRTSLEASPMRRRRCKTRLNATCKSVYSPPPVSSMLHQSVPTTTTTKSWRSDTLIILPGWECHTGGSRSKPTVHRCSQRGRRLWVARQVHNHEPNGSATMQQETVHQCQHGSGAVQIHSTMSSTLSQIHSTLDRAVRSVGAVSLWSHEVEVETVATIVKEVIVRRSWE